MAGGNITTATELTCPHGGQVAITSANGRVKVAGAQAALVTDSFTVAGCPFQIPAVVPIPSPCMTVLWLMPDIRDRVGGPPTLSNSSVGLCIAATGLPQGPVLIGAGQVNTKTT